MDGSLEPLTAYHGERPSPKALLPIGNKAMLNFPLAWLEDAGIRGPSQPASQNSPDPIRETNFFWGGEDVLLVAPSAHKAALSHFIHSEASFPTLKIDLETIDSNEEMGSGMGTADIIRRFSDRIQVCLLIPFCKRMDGGVMSDFCVD